MLHQLIKLTFPVGCGLGFAEMPQVRCAAERPNIHLGIWVSISPAQSHDRCIVIEALKHTVNYGAKFEGNDVDLHSQVREVVLQQGCHLHALRVRRVGDDGKFDRTAGGIQQLAGRVPGIPG